MFPFSLRFERTARFDSSWPRVDEPSGIRFLRPLLYHAAGMTTSFDFWFSFSILSLVCISGCANYDRSENSPTRASRGEDVLFRLREQRHALNVNGGKEHWLTDSLKQALSSGLTDPQQAQVQLELWLKECDSWTATPLPGQINTDADEFGPIPVNDSLMYFTRGRGASTLCYSEDVFNARLSASGWVSRSLGRTINTCHNESITSISADDTVAYCYGQYYSQYSNKDGGIVLTANYPNDLATQTTVTYVYDPISDYQTPNYFLFSLPIVTEHGPDVHKNFVARSRASTIIDYSGDIYKYRFVNGNLYGSPKRVGWPVSGVDWESDAVLNPEGTLLYFVSDRPNDLFSFDEKPAHRSKKVNGWGNTNIFYTSVEDSIAERHYILGHGINTSFSERTPSFSAKGDTLFFSSNGLPGYGGMDVYYSVRLRGGARPLWSTPRNMGPGVNTSADELWFRSRSDGTYLFARRTNGNLDIFAAVRKPLLRVVNVYGACNGSKSLTFSAHFYDGHIESQRLKYDTTTIYLADGVQRFSVSVEGQEHPRFYDRCPVLSDSIGLAEESYSIKYCGVSETIHFGAYDLTWSFLPNESVFSILAAVNELVNTQFSTKGLRRLEISIARGHDTEYFRKLIDYATLKQAAVIVHQSDSSVSQVSATFR